MILHLLAVGLMSLAPGEPARGDTWPEFRGPEGNGRSDATGLPVEWSESKNVAWKTPIHDMGWSSPVVWGDQVWLTTATPDGKKMYAICVDAKTGRIRLDTQLFSPTSPDQSFKKFNSFASSTPAIEDGRVYVHFGTYGTAALDTQSGRVLWKRDDLPCNHWRGAGSSPILYKNLLIVNFDGYDHQYIVALDKETGKTVWKKDRSHDYKTDNGDLKKAYGTCSVITAGGRAELISPAAKAVQAYDPMTGAELWRVTFNNHSTASRPTYEGGVLYLNTGFSGAEIMAVRPGGSGDVSRKQVVWKKGDKNLGRKSTLVLVDGLIYNVSDKNIATCLDAKTGKILWAERIKGKAHSASPVYADGHVYFLAEDGLTTVLKTGRAFNVAATNKLDGGGRCMGSPAIVGKAIYLRTATHLYRIEKR